MNVDTSLIHTWPLAQQRTFNLVAGQPAAKPLVKAPAMATEP